MLTKRSRTALIAAAACVLLMSSGCGNNGNNNANSGNNANNGNNGVQAQNYPDDGYMGITNTNPRIPGHNMTNTYANDSQAISEAIRNVPGVAGSRVTFNGADAYVTIKVDPSLRPNEVPTVESQAASVLRFNFPRYTIHVSSMR
jgi:Sporulation lipoprotein YhcN/YlaJ (Spore_YhcN_YlaJ).